MEKVTNENIIIEEVHEGYVKTLKEHEDGTWEAKFINTIHDIVLFETHKPLKSTASSMAGSFIKNFDYEKDKDRGIPKKKELKGGKNYFSSTNSYGTPEKVRNQLAIPQRIEIIKDGCTIEEIDGAIVHFLPNQWASKYKFCHKDINYSLDIDWTNKDQIEIYMSNTNDYLLGSNYTRDHAPKLIKWLKSDIYEQIKNDLFTEDDDVIHPETPNKYKNKMIIWQFHNYNVMCSKGV